MCAVNKVLVGGVGLTVCDMAKIVDRTRYGTHYMFLCVKSCSSASSGHAYQVNV